MMKEEEEKGGRGRVESNGKKENEKERGEVEGEGLEFTFLEENKAI